VIGVNSYPNFEFQGGGSIVRTRIVDRFLMGAAFLLMTGAFVSAQTGTIPTNRSSHPAEGNPACGRILNECKRLGFIAGQAKKDNGLWKDCFDPIVKGGGTPTRDGRAINVPVSQSDLQTCRAFESHHR